jgi:hypothetical protein
MSPLTTSEVPAPKALDIQHDTDPARDHGPAKHFPHIGHALLFFTVAWLSLMVAQVITLSAAHIHTEEAIRGHQGLEMVGQAASYVVTLLVSWILFREIWQMPFVRGIEWNWLAVKRWWYWIVALGAIVSGIAQMSLHFVSEPKDSPIDQILRTTHGAWMMTGFGVVLAPLTEEIAFRGFLLPALAIGYDWLMMDRTPAGLERWQRSSLHSRAGLIFAAVFSNIPFALLHAGQLQHAWGALGILYGVGLVLSAVRVRTNSVAASVLMHATYNLTVFIVLFVGTDGYRHMDKFLH